MKDCEKCLHINLTEEDYAKADKLGYVVERLTEKQFGTLDRVPLCILYGKICTNWDPCEKCKENKYKEYKERL